MAVRSTLGRAAQRIAFPRIYDDPAKLAQEAADLARTVPESDALKQLFGVNRDELYELSKSRTRGAESVVKKPEKSRGAAAAEPIMGKKNTQRILDILEEGGKRPELYKGMDSWYETTPMYDRILDLVGPEVAPKYFKQLNAFTGMASPMSDVLTEISRGTGANWLANQGRIQDFLKYGGKADAPGRPADMAGIPGHMAHSTAQAPSMLKYLESGGNVQMNSPKVPAYIQSSLPESLGGSWGTPVGDAHWSRAIGLADTRNTKTIKGQPAVPDQSVSTPELNTLRDWWDSDVASELGILPVPAQARLWGTASKATGVQTPVGQSKLELFADKIAGRARQLGVDPSAMRDYILVGGDLTKLSKGVKKYAPFFAAAAAGTPIAAFADMDLTQPDTTIMGNLPMPSMDLVRKGVAKEQQSQSAGNVNDILNFLDPAFIMPQALGGGVDTMDGYLRSQTR